MLLFFYLRSGCVTINCNSTYILRNDIKITGPNYIQYLHTCCRMWKTPRTCSASGQTVLGAFLRGSLLSAIKAFGCLGCRMPSHQAPSSIRGNLKEVNVSSALFQPKIIDNVFLDPTNTFVCTRCGKCLIPGLCMERKR